MDQSLAVAVGGGIFTSLSVLANVLQGYHNARLARKTETNSDMVSDAKAAKELATAWQDRANEYKTLYELEHKEHAEDRKASHERVKEAQKNLFTMQNKLDELSLRPDLTDLLDQLKDQSLAINHLVELIKPLIEHLQKPIFKQP